MRNLENLIKVKGIDLTEANNNEPYNESARTSNFSGIQVFTKDFILTPSATNTKMSFSQNTNIRSSMHKDTFSSINNQRKSEISQIIMKQENSIIPEIVNDSHSDISKSKPMTPMRTCKDSSPR